jgi:transcriptional regulator with XRE-family HTH domain
MTEEILKRIKLLGLKKAHVAKRIGASPSEFSHFLSGRRGIDPGKLAALKLYLDLK